MPDFCAAYGFSNELNIQTRSRGITFHRQNGIGIGSMCARIGGVLAPMLHLLRGISPHAPMVLCGLSPLLGAALTLLLPETANQHLPDTIEDVEASNLSEEKPMDFETPMRKTDVSRSTRTD